MRTETIRGEIAALLRRAPFEPFSITLESGEQLLIEHPENLAFAPQADPQSHHGQRLFVALGEYFLITTFEAVTSVASRRGDDSAA